MRRNTAAGVVILNMATLLSLAAAVMAQSEPQPDPKPPSAKPAVGKVQFERGMVLTAEGGHFKAIVASVTVPGDWPGQQRVRTVKQNLSAGVKISFRTIDDVGRQMVIRIPSLAAGEEARALVTFEVEPLQTPVPQDAQSFTAPDTAKLGRKMAVYLTPSPHIESDHADLRKAAREAAADRTGAWGKVQGIHEWVQKHVKYEANHGKEQSVMETLRLGKGDCDEMNSLAVAMCRANGMAARLVRVPGHCTYEVYLLDGEGQGHWFYGDASRFPTIQPENMPGGVIMQKGDNVTVADPRTKRSVRKRFLEETAVGLPQSKGARLAVKLVNE